MRINEVKTLLEENGFPYEAFIVKNPIEYYYKKGYCSSKNRKPFWLIIIPNPNHEKNIEIIFKDAEENSEFFDLEFGYYCYELFDYIDMELSSKLVQEIRDVMQGNVYIIEARDAKTGKCFWVGGYENSSDESLNNMDEFEGMIERIKAPKLWLWKLCKRTDMYEIYNWKTYNTIIK